MDRLKTFYAVKESKSFSQFQSKDEYISAMVEDLCEWFNYIYDLQDNWELNPGNFFDNLKDGVILCKHASNVQLIAENYLRSKCIKNRQISVKSGNQKLTVPFNPPMYTSPATNKANNVFIQRTNVESFIKWCREFNVPIGLTFETEDLVLLKNIKSVVVCLLEIAKIGGYIGMDVPDIIKLEREVENEVHQSNDSGFINDDKSLHRTDDNDNNNNSSEEDKQERSRRGLENSFGYRRRNRSNSLCLTPTDKKQILQETIKFDTVDYSDSRNVNNMQKRPGYVPPTGEIRLYDCFNKIRNQNVKKPVVTCDLKTLDEKVREAIQECKCENMFPMKKLRDGYYEFGEKKICIFVRIMRNHVMVRVGGGWDVLNNFLHRHDPCRKEKTETKFVVPHNDILPSRIHIKPNDYVPNYKGMSQGMLQVRRNKEELSIVTKKDLEPSDSTDSISISGSRVSTKSRATSSVTNEVTQRSQTKNPTSPQFRPISMIVHSPQTLEFQLAEMQILLNSNRSSSSTSLSSTKRPSKIPILSSRKTSDTKQK